MMIRVRSSMIDGSGEMVGLTGCKERVIGDRRGVIQRTILGSPL